MAVRQYSTKLIDDIMQHPMDPAYESAKLAGRRTSKFNVIIFALMIIMGFLIIQSAIYLTTSHQESGTIGLLSEIQGQIQANTQIGETVQEMSTELSGIMSVVNGIDAANRRLSDLREHDDKALVGTGIVIGIDMQNSTATLKDLDLQAIVNQLFSSGAEAVAINSERLSATTAIRTAGSTILVNLKHITSPYSIAAIGDSRQLSESLRVSAAGGILAYLTESAADVTINERNDVLIPKQNVYGKLKYARS
ncbi:MAG: DUF881 domain-containing protein [Bifidobacteriaceae bacterium]|jgi:uncharacterized protein YlxW (UPF0749 family)|nr:DUF881 domain-containing protein [Bifidobacteriaceae bacterium]